MGLFSRKPKIGIEEFCRDFYDSQIFHAIIAGEDIGSAFYETAFNSITEADQSFAAIDLTVFRQEMTAIRLELFGLAWGHRFKEGKLAISQNVFTRHYLEESDKLNLWDIMGKYNHVIAQSATMAESGKQTDTWRIVKVNKARVDMFDKWADANIDNSSAPTEQEEILTNCIARVANRIGADIRRNDCILVKRLAASLADRLGCNINLKTEALFRLSAVIFGLYEGAMEALKSVNLQS